MLNTTILAALGTPEIIIILVVVLLLLAVKIPELMRGLGKGVKEFKDGKDGDEHVDLTTPINHNGFSKF
ncbi:twin-arginine translocase TatA/TatE family subunit [Pedobacter sp. IW39]|nr:twin-arginine translocase TatA/TatE family subunit [Pedobacter sp. IW39]